MTGSSRRVALITGAGSGIGAATARRLAAAGCDLGLHTGTRADRLAAVAADCTAAGARVIQQLGDLSEADRPAALVAAVEDAFGRLDVLVSNAGFADRRDLEQLDPAMLIRSHEAMTGAFVRLAAAALPLLRRSDSGRIVAVSSFVAHKFSLGGVAFPASAAAKAGLEAVALSLAARLAADGVTVNCVVPGYTRKDTGAHAALDSSAWQAALARIPLGRLGQPDDAAAAISFLASAEAGYITGQRLHVDGGLML